MRGGPVIGRLSIRAKLGLLVAVPLVALVLVATPGVTGRVDQVQAEGRARDLAAGPAAGLAGTVDAIQQESALSAWYQATGDATVLARLHTARAATDARIAALPQVAQAAAGAGATDTAARVGELRRAAALIDSQRSAVDARVAPDDSLIDTYRGVADSALRALDATALAPRDSGAAANLRDTATLTRIANAAGLERAIVVDAFARGGISDALTNELAAAVATQEASREAFLGQAGDELRNLVDARTAASTTSAAVTAMRNEVLGRQARQSGFTPGQWYDTSSAHVGELFATVAAARARTQSLAADRRQQALEEALLYVGGALAAFLLAAGLTIAIARAIVRPIRRLTRAARTVSQRQLPALVDALAHEDGERLPEIAPIPVDTRDEIGELAEAFNDIETTAVTVAKDQRAALQKGIGDLYLNLARRNQTLLERQFGVIDELEADEEDPERLDALFRLDHLATRMRRNAESLLVLAGLDEVRPHTAPVTIREVVRGALSEIVDYARVDVVGVSEWLAVRGDVAVDLSHAVAELLENAASFSPPQSRIFVSGERRGADYELTISDEGIGIAPDRVATVNALLANPPLPGLQLSKALGLVVVARLMARIGAKVRLRSAPEVGTSALITLPVALIVDRPDASGPGWAAPPEPAPLPVAAPAAEAVPDPTILPRTSRVARRRGRKRRGRVRGTPAPVRASAEGSGGPAPVAPAGDVTAAGLPKRSPTEPTTVDLTKEQPLAPSPRPPDEVFELVARFEAGRRRVDSDATSDQDRAPEEGPE